MKNYVRWDERFDRKSGRRRPRKKKVAVPAPRVEEEDVPFEVYFLRAHTQALLRRYYHASAQLGRIGCALIDSVGRGWVSSRPVRSFEDVLIFVIDMSRCIERLNPLDREMLTRLVKHDYTQAEAALLIGVSARTVAHKFPTALDRLTVKLLDAGILIVTKPARAA